MKAEAFNYEQEWRVVLNKKNVNDPVIRVSIADIGKILEHVYVSPEEPNWMVSSISNLVRDQFGLKRVSVSKSPLAKHFRI